jgi:hypothetical protein
MHVELNIFRCREWMALSMGLGGKSVIEIIFSGLGPL